MRCGQKRAVGRRLSGRYGALRRGARSAAADEFAAAYQGECAAGGPYGALETILGEYEHRVTVAVETVAVPDGLGVDGLDAIKPHHRRHEGKEC